MERKEQRTAERMGDLTGRPRRFRWAALAAGRREGGAGGDGAWPLVKEKAAAREGGGRRKGEGRGGVRARARR